MKDLFNHEAESVVLGAMLQEKYGELPPINVTDFHDERNKYLFTILSQMHIAREPIDIVAAHERVVRSGRSEEIGGAGYLAAVVESFSSTSGAIGCAHTIKDYSARRKLSTLSRSLEAASQDGRIGVVEVTAQIKMALDEIASQAAPVESSSPRDFLPEYLSGLEKIANGQGVLGIPTRFTELNRIMSGFVPGEVTILAGRPKNGKTALALNILDDIAGNGFPAGIISLEMTRRLLANRQFSSGARVEGRKFRNGQFSPEDWSKIMSFADKYAALPMRYYDNPGLKPSMLDAICSKWKKEFGLSFLAIDYVQLMSPDNRLHNREREVAEISRAIKIAAVTHNIPILVLAQLNRAADQSDKPLLSQLRDSGALEQDADNVIFICPWEYPESGAWPVVNVSVSKGRNCSEGTFSLTYNQHFLRFENHYAAR